MNSAPNQSNNNTFSTQQPGTQSNPFTNDLKGEFSSNFGGATNFGTNAGATNVSQIFKDGNYSGNNNKRYIMYGVLAVVALGVGYFLLSEDSPTEETPSEEVATEDGAAKPEEAPAATPAPTETAQQAAQPAAQPAASAAGESAATGPISLASPANGSSLAYDETQGSASFSWSGGPGTIVFSRSSTMQPEVMRVKVSGTSYSFHRPWPGQWYWKVESEAGASEVRSFTVEAPVRRSIALTSPASGGTLAGTGGAVSWTGDKGVAYYRVELNQSDDWSNPQYKFSSSGSQLQLNGVAPGQYSMRLGAFSEVSGRWEYTQPIQVAVQ